MFKDFFVIPSIAPQWLLGAIGKLKLQTIGTTLDQLTGDVTGKSAAAAEASMPTKCDVSALPLIGNDVLLTQGSAEPVANFRLRLKQAIDTWRQFAGNDWGIMLQALAQITGLNGATAPRVRVISNSGIWTWFEAGADTTQPPWYQNQGAWEWDQSAPHGPDVTPGQESFAWWRVWMSLESVGSAAFATQWPTLGTGGQPTLGNLATGSLGFQNVSPAVWNTLRSVLEVFRAKHSPIRWILVTFATNLINPAFTADDVHNPDGTWGYGYKIVGGQYVASWIANILPVPGAYGGNPPGSPNNLANATYGYRIVGGQYLPY